VSPLIAIVDDEEPVRKALQRLLRAARLHTDTYASCELFQEALARRRPNCLILDLHLPGMSGLELLYELQQHGIAPPTIVITAHDDAETRDRCQRAGAVSYLRKPVDSSVLLSAIIRVLVENKTLVQ
jgi:FixJ family two-component response regulator